MMVYRVKKTEINLSVICRVLTRRNPQGLEVIKYKLTPGLAGSVRCSPDTYLVEKQRKRGQRPLAGSSARGHGQASACANRWTGCSQRKGVLISICHLQVSQSVMTRSGFRLFICANSPSPMVWLVW